MIATDQVTGGEEVAGRVDPASADQAQFSVPQSAMLLVVVSGGFWCAIAIAVRYLFF